MTRATVCCLLILCTGVAATAQTPAPSPSPAASQLSEQQASNVLVGRFLFGFLLATSASKIRAADTCKDFGDALRAKADAEIRMLAQLFGPTIANSADTALPDGTKANLTTALDGKEPWDKRRDALMALEKTWTTLDAASSTHFSFARAGIAVGDLSGQGMHVTAHGPSYSVTDHGLGALKDAQDAITGATQLDITRTQAGVILGRCPSCPGAGPDYMRKRIDAILTLWGPPSESPTRPPDTMIRIAQEGYALAQEAIQQLQTPIKR